MKLRSAVVFIPLLGAIGPLIAQNDPTVRFGLLLAPTSANLRVESDELNAAENRTAFNFGLLADFPSGQSDHWYVSSGLVYTNIGGSINPHGTVDRGTGPMMVAGHLDARMHYLELPLALKWRTGSGGPWDTYVLGGLTAALHLGTRVDGTRTLTDTNGVVSPTVYDNASLNSEIALLKTGLVVGAGVEYSLPAGLTLFTGVRYSRAFSDALDRDAGSFVTDSDRSSIFPDYWEISVGVFLRP